MRLSLFAALVAVLVAGCSFVPSDMVDIVQNASSPQNATDSVSSELVERTIQGLDQATVRSDGTADIGLGERAQFDIAYQPLKRAQNKELVQRGDRYVLSEKQAQRGTRASTQAAGSPYEVLVYRKEMYGTEALEYELVLNEQPNTSSFVFDLNTSNLDLFYQPPLHEEAGLKAPNETCNATDCGDSHRPAHVVGSYAAYYKDTTRNGETGKAFHIYRPWLNDSNGNKVWADLSIQDGTLTITPPDGYLDKAAYPVVVDPTFGYTTTGGTGEEIAQDCSFGSCTSFRAGASFSLSEDGNITNISAALDGSGDATGTFHFSVNDKDSDGANSHGEIVTKTEDIFIDISFSGFYTMDVTSTAVTSGDYILNVAADAEDAVSFGSWFLEYDSATSIDGYKEDVGSNTATISDPWNVAVTTTDRKYSIYATYESSGGGGGPSDSCSPDGASTHTYECTDACNVTSGIDFGANDVTFNGSGTVRIDGVSLNTTGDVRIQNSCTVRLENGGVIQ